jgi:mycofactocin precursor
MSDMTDNPDAPTMLSLMTDDDVKVRSDAPAEPYVEEDLLVEEISIDGMCGVY